MYHKSHSHIGSVSYAFKVNEKVFQAINQFLFIFIESSSMNILLYSERLFFVHLSSLIESVLDIFISFIELFSQELFSHTFFNLRICLSLAS